MHKGIIAKLFAVLALAATCTLTGCANTQSKSMLERMFPANPDDSFLGDEAREIDKRLSSSGPRVDL